METHNCRACYPHAIFGNIKASGLLDQSNRPINHPNQQQTEKIKLNSTIEKTESIKSAESINQIPFQIEKAEEVLERSDEIENYPLNFIGDCYRLLV